MYLRSPNFKNIFLKLIKVSKSDFSELVSVFNEYWSIKSENYNQESIVAIILNYKIFYSSFKVDSTRIDKPVKVKPNLLKFGSFNFYQF